MTIIFSAALLCAIASAAPSASAAGANSPVASAVHASTATAPAPSAANALGVSTYTVSTLYTGDKVRDPFLPPSVGGGPSHPRDRNAPNVVDIHALELRGIMKDGKNDFAIFSTDSGGRLILRGRRLYDDHNKVVPGITGFIHMKQKRAELITADKDVQIYSLGEPDANKAKDAQPDESEETGSGRSP
ncbi:MAG: hypothetical protein ACHQ2Z_10320 [Elusimicrobiota bacterium]